MPEIKVLPVELRNKIAAGEVIERPASVVKELIENSIDAGSTDIRVEVLRGGKGLVRVTDNGTGMDREDALFCLHPHATSKLRNEEDLFHITTMGFRGEALPSIASVSKMKIVTGLKDSPSGRLIEVQGGEVTETRDFPARGTSVEVRDLFFNTPARKKFLKSDGTELYHIIDSVTKEALSHEDIAFRLLTENQETMNLSRASGPRERITQVYGLDFVEGLSEIHAESEGTTMTAFVTKGENYRNSKTHQYIFINRRPVKDQTVSHALYQAYEGILPQARHPVFFLFIDMNPKKIDFNVHPAKREVRFENKDEMHRFVAGRIREALRKERTEYVTSFREIPDRPGFERPFGHNIRQMEPSAPSRYIPPMQPDRHFSEGSALPYQASLPFIYLGDTFIAMAGKGGLTLLDHHAAHERILYEHFLKGIAPASHHLLFPKQVMLSHKEYRIILENTDLLDEMGIEVDDFGHNTLLIRSLPEALKESDMRGILSDVAASLIEGVRPDSSLRETIAARISCHASVRGKEILSSEEVQRLLSDLEKTEHPDQCPHGRPTRLFFSLDDLKKMFKRK
ncbi:MAG TPA: DNA mismatch repair endonuclease MutL [Thermodesulfovibrionales bacterium]|nr:DNA mismatch repair endonuclease MutL [Thermodesulfovibrionales bacterium]